jgi:hypothetical protein
MTIRTVRRERAENCARASLLIAVLLAAIFSFAQQKPAQPAGFPPPPPVSPEVHSDGSVTFRLQAPNAKEVKLDRQGTPLLEMQRDDHGVWSVTTAPLQPDYYGYSFSVDGVRTMDASNPLLVPNLIFPSNAVHVPGPPSLPWELNDIPHGEIHHHFYRSAIASDDRDYYVHATGLRP